MGHRLDAVVAARAAERDYLASDAFAGLLRDLGVRLVPAPCAREPEP
jgi:hypothetical protein